MKILPHDPGPALQINTAQVQLNYSQMAVFKFELQAMAAHN